jgi:tetratricopeptide (TPR) repeat protein
MAPGYPNNVREYDPREVALLPRYCIYTQEFRQRIPGGNNQAEINRWHLIMGDTFEAMHHYCWGLMKTNRAMLFARNKQTRMFYFGDAIDEFDFVIRRAKPDFVMLPEILTKKGDNLIRLGSGPRAIPELQRAIELKPDYWPPSAVMSDYYKATGDIKKAREVLEKALSFSPNAKALKTRLAELDGATDKRKTAPQSGQSQQTLKP